MQSGRENSRRIYALPPILAAQIAAGEVIERPATALKELLENSLDAGASEINIALKDGGIDLLHVADNGSGMLAEDMPLAFKRHATSKIRTAEDLMEIYSFGFRGEALASLAAVADVTLCTRPPQDKHGWEFRPGMSAPKPRPMPPGSEIFVRQLFAAVPARRRFLRTAATEAAHCTAAVYQAALAAPAVAFGYHINGKQRLQLPAATLSERLTTLFAPLDNNLITLHEENAGITLSGCVFSPALSNSGKRYGQFIYVNGRIVRDKLLRRAVADALRHMTHDSEPGYALALHIAADKVDVNVHPAKLEVRFSDPRLVFEFIRRALDKALSVPLTLPVRDYQWDKHTKTRHVAQVTTDWTTQTGTPAARHTPHTQALPGSEAATAAWQQMFSDMPPPASSSLSHAATTETTEPATLIDEQPLGRALGQLHDIYIIAENRAGLVIVDMHAAHERLLYEQLKTAADNNSVPMQPFLTPIQVALADWQADTLRQYEGTLTGIDVRLIDGNTAEISAISTFISRCSDPILLLTDILHDLANEGSGNQAIEQRDNILSTVACHAAIRANRRLDNDEMNTLLRQMEVSERSGTCNHGRPCWQQIERQYFDRIFKRGR